MASPQRRARQVSLAKQIQCGGCAEQPLHEHGGSETQPQGSPHPSHLAENVVRSRILIIDTGAEEPQADDCGLASRRTAHFRGRRTRYRYWPRNSLHDAVDILPILLITSPLEDCGKSTLLKLVLYLSNRPIPASNISAAAIYRTIGDNHPTLVLDEADAFMQEDEAMRGVINSGHERQLAYVIRVVNDSGDTGQFSTWCPKAIARIGQPKRTILSRSIPIRLERKSKGTKTEKLKSGHKLEFEDLRRKISRLANDIRAQVQLFRSQADWLNNRAGDNWEPLFAIATAAGDEWLKATEAAALTMSQKVAQDSKSFGHYLLECLGDIFAERREQLRHESLLEPEERFFFRTKDLLPLLNNFEEAPWRERQDQVLTAHKLGKELKEYDIIPDEVKEGPERGRGYWSDQIEAAVEKYKTEVEEKTQEGEKPEAGEQTDDGGDMECPF